MPQQGTPYLIPFGSAGMVAHPNRWRAKAGEILLGENVVVENDLINKEPAATYYDRLGGISQATFGLRWGGATVPVQIEILVWYDTLPTATVTGQSIATGATA